MKGIDDLIDLLIIAAIGLGLYFGARAFLKGDSGGCFGTGGPTGSVIPPASGAPFKLTPPTASLGNSFWQWLTYLFNLPEGYMSHDQVAASLQSTGGGPGSAPDYDNMGNGLPDPGGAFSRFAQSQGIS